MEQITKLTGGNGGTALQKVANLPAQIYQSKMQALRNEFNERALALKNQQESIEYDTGIIHAVMNHVGVDEIISAIQTNESKGQSLHFWIRETSHDAVKIILCEVVNYFRNSFSTEKFFTDEHILRLCQFFISHLPYTFRFSDLIYILNSARNGKWGTIYGAMDEATFFGWVEKWKEEIEANAVNEHLDRTQSIRPAFDSLEDIYATQKKRWITKATPDENWFNPNIKSE